MINVIFKMSKDFNTYPNELVPISNDYEFWDGSQALAALSKTNIFIGENNSGKSRFLRHLFRNDFWALDNAKVEEFHAAMRTTVADRDLGDEKGSRIFNAIYRITQQAGPHTYRKTEQFFQNLKPYSSKITSHNKYYFPTARGVKDYKSVLDTKLRHFAESATSIQNKDSINHYISLLNLEHKGLESFDIYREITRHEYFPKGELNIVTGGDLYATIKSMLLGEEQERKLISDFQMFLREHFFSEYASVQLIPNESKKVLFVKIGSDERPIYDWGDGTQQLIIILFSLFIHKDETDNMFFIEEPEIYLHPGILRKFIEVINSDVFPHHQYFITTHSNVVLDTSADSNVNMSIFKFIKKKSAHTPAFVIEQCNNGDVSLLNVLGIRNSSVFLANCSIWVEGITDRLYLKHYLGLYFKQFECGLPCRENIDYTFIEYGGNNIVHFNFSLEDVDDKINAKYVNNRIFLIADNDNTREGSKKDIRKKHLRELLGDNFYELPVTEIENLLPQDVIMNVLIQQNPNCAELIKQKFEEPRKYQAQKLGSYLDKLFKGSAMRQYADESGTVRNKLAFCETALKHITDYDMLSVEAKTLVESIVGFIRANSQV